MNQGPECASAYVWEKRLQLSAFSASALSPAWLGGSTLQLTALWQLPPCFPQPLEQQRLADRAKEDSLNAKLIAFLFRAFPRAPSGLSERLIWICAHTHTTHGVRDPSACTSSFKNGLPLKLSIAQTQSSEPYEYAEEF